MKNNKPIAWSFLFLLYSGLCYFIANITAKEFGGNFVYWMVFFEIVIAGIPILVAWAIATIVEVS